MKYSNLFHALEKLGLNPPKEEVDQLVETYVHQVRDTSTYHVKLNLAKLSKYEKGGFSTMM